MTSSVNSILFLTRDHFEFVDAAVSSVLRFDFIPSLVRDMEVVNPSLFEEQIKGFIETDNLSPSEMVILLSDNVQFVKDFTSVLQDQQDTEEEQVQAFVDTVPFENTSAKVFQFETGKKIIAVNQDLYETIKNAFQKLGFSITFVVPSFIIDPAMGGLTQDAITAVFKRAGEFKEFNLITETVVETQPKNTAPTNKRKINIRLVISIGVFLVLIAILVAVVISNK